MKWDFIEYFTAVARYRSFSRAAEAMFITQSALSKQIASIEEELGVRLFERDNRRVAMTPAGEYLLKESRRINARIQNTLREMRYIQSGEQRELVIQCSWDCSTDLSLIIAAFSKKRPDVHIKMIQELYQFPVAREFHSAPDLSLRSYDLEEKPGGVALKSYREQLQLNAYHPLCAKERLSLSDLQGMDLVMLNDYPPHNRWKKYIRENCPHIGVIETDAYNDLISALITRPLRAAFIWGASFRGLNFSRFVPFAEGRQQELRLLPAMADPIPLIQEFMDTAREVFPGGEGGMGA